MAIHLNKNLFTYPLAILCMLHASIFTMSHQIDTSSVLAEALASPAMSTTSARAPFARMASSCYTFFRAQSTMGQLSLLGGTLTAGYFLYQGIYNLQQVLQSSPVRTRTLETRMLAVGLFWHLLAEGFGYTGDPIVRFSVIASAYLAIAESKKLYRQIDIIEPKRVDRVITYYNVPDYVQKVVIPSLQQNNHNLPAGYQYFIKRYKINPSRHLLLYGPPGTGKTELANYIAGVAQTPLLKISAGKLFNPILGSTSQSVEYIVRSAKDAAKEHGKCILFIDEFDVVAANDQVAGALKNTIEKLSEQNVVVIACTNFIHKVPEALWRPQRFHPLFIGKLPKHDQRALLMEKLRERPLSIESSAALETAIKELMELDMTPAEIINSLPVALTAFYGEEPISTVAVLNQMKTVIIDRRQLQERSRKAQDAEEWQKKQEAER